MTFRTTLLAAFAIPATIAAASASAQDDAQAAQQMINDPNPAKFKVTGPTPVPKSVVDTSVQGERSITVPATGSGNPWDVQVSVPVNKPIKAGDNLVVMFYAKLAKPDAPTGKIDALIQLGAAPYTPIAQGSFDVTPEWQLLTFKGKADKDYRKGTLNTTFQLNKAPQTITMGLVAVFDKGQ